MTSIATKIRRIEQRLKNLEKVSHKQPDMKEIIRDVAAVMAFYEKDSAVAPKRPRSPRRIIARHVRRPPGVRC